MATAVSKADIESIAGRIHTAESFGRSIIGSVLQNAAKDGRKADGNGNISLPGGRFTIKQVEQKFREASMQVWVCWEDEAAQQSICIDVTDYPTR